MDDLWAEQEQVGMASINAFVIMYGGKSDDNLTKLRFVTILVFLLKLLRVFIFPNVAEVRKQKFIPQKFATTVNLKKTTTTTTNKQKRSGKQCQNENKSNKDSNLMYLYH